MVVRNEKFFLPLVASSIPIPPPVTASVFMETYCYVSPLEPQSSPLTPTDVVAVEAGSVLCVCC